MKKAFILFMLGVLFTFYRLSAQQTLANDSVAIKWEQDLQKEVSRYEDGGWQVYPGTLPMKKQLINSWSKQMTVDTAGFPLWVVTSSRADDLLLEDAYVNASVIATNQLADLLETQFTRKVHRDLDSNKLSTAEAEHIIWEIKTSIELVLVSTGGVERLFRIYRTRGEKNEVAIMLGCKLSELKKSLPLQLQGLMMDDDAQTRARHKKYLNPDYYSFE